MKKLMILQLIAKYTYTFNKYKTEKIPDRQIYVHDVNKKEAIDIIKQVEIANLNRDMQNEPSNVMYPDSFVKYVKTLLGPDIHIKALNDVQLKQQGFNLVHAVGKASVRKPRFLIIHYAPAPKYPTVCLIGKGVTFDLGGSNMKPSTPELRQMKSDKIGGCTVVSLIKYAKDSKMKLNILGLIPLVENVVSGNGLLPGDVVKSYNGKTVEVVNTDAEGRLIIADSLGYAATRKIDYLIDLATLTSDSYKVNCDTTAAFFTVNNKLRDLINKISEQVGERVFALPPWEEYVEYTKSEIADVKNSYFDKCKQSETFMATMFLLNFVDQKMKGNFVHFDIAHTYINQLANGNTTILLIQLLKELSKDVPV